MTGSRIDHIPRCALAQIPTPIHRVEFGPRRTPLLIKRDDLTGWALTGNKVRKLEYLLADARAQNADTLVTCGAVHSNCARALAAGAAMTGMHSTLILTGTDDERRLDGNLLVCRMVGSDVRLLPAMTHDQRDRKLAEITDDLRRRGRRPYRVPYGGSSEIGALGYVRAAFEICQQLGSDLDRVRFLVTPMASGGTYAGLFIGFQLAGVDVRPIGAYVERDCRFWAAWLAEFIASTAERFDLPVRVCEEDILLIDARGSGYGRADDQELDGIVRFASETGVILDPVYTGKAMCAMQRYIGRDRHVLSGEVMFLHTGGGPGLFPFRQGLAAALDRRDARPSAPQTPSRPDDLPEPIRARMAPVPTPQPVKTAVIR